MQFIKNHWFGLFISLFMLYFLGVFFIVMIAPHQDEQKRGFVPCTEKMAEKLHDCDSKKICVLDVVIKNTFCDIRIINQGIMNWVKGKQPSPWASYLFTTPKSAEQIQEDKEWQEYTGEKPNFDAQMNELDTKRQELEAVLAAPPSVVFEGAAYPGMDEILNDSEDAGPSSFEELDDNNGEDDE